MRSSSLGNDYLHDSSIPTLDRLFSITPIISPGDKHADFEKKLERVEKIYKDLIKCESLKASDTLTCTKLLHFISVLVDIETQDIEACVVKSIATLNEMGRNQIHFEEVSIFQGGFWGLEIATVIVSAMDNHGDEALYPSINVAIHAINEINKLVPTKNKREIELTKNSLSRDFVRYLAKSIEKNGLEEGCQDFRLHVRKCIVLTGKIVEKFGHEFI